MNDRHSDGVYAALRTLAALGLGLAAAAGGVAAQTYTACRVPDVGAIYMIGVAGTPSACLDPSHVQFSWTEGGQVADGAVTTDKIADDAIIGSKIANYQIENIHIVPKSIDGTAIAANSIGGAEIENGSIGLFDLQENSVGPVQLGLEVVTVQEPPTIPGLAEVVVTCPAGKRVISGGYRLIAATGALEEDLGIPRNGPLNATQWVVRARWPDAPAAWEWAVYAICIIDGS